MVIIIGAGPAGLAAGYWLKQHNIQFKILEKNTVGNSWQNHYDSLSLHTLKGVSHLPGLPMPADYPDFAPRHLVAEYLQNYAGHFNFDIEENTKVIQTRHHSYHDTWHISTTRGQFTANRLIVASGIWSTPFVPNFHGLDRYAGECLHAANYKNARPFTSKRVLIVGGGNSGSEIATEISQVAKHTAIAIKDGTTFVDYPKSEQSMRTAAWLFRTLPAIIGHQLLKRSRPDFSELKLFPPEGNLTDAYPVVGFELPKAIKDGRVHVYPTGIDQIAGQTVHFSDGQQTDFDTIVMATGYRPTLNFVNEYVERDNNGKPKLNKHWQSTLNPNLYAVGFEYPNTEGWLQSIPRFTQQAVRHLAQTHPKKQK